MDMKFKGVRGEWESGPESVKLVCWGVVGEGSEEEIDACLSLPLGFSVGQNENKESGSVVRTQIPIPNTNTNPNKGGDYVSFYLEHEYESDLGRVSYCVYTHTSSTRTTSLMMVKSMSCKKRETLRLQFTEKHSG